MEHKWQYNQIWPYFDYDTDAIYTISEEIGKLPEQEQDLIYRDISDRIYNYVLNYNRGDDMFYELVGAMINDIYRTMNKAIYYTNKQSKYLENTAKTLLIALKKKGIVVHFGTSNYFEHPKLDILREMFRYFWEDSGFICFETIGLADDIEKKKEIAKRLRELGTEHYALMIPNGKEEDFQVMFDSIGKPGVMNFFKYNDAIESRYSAFDYCPPGKVDNPKDKPDLGYIELKLDKKDKPDVLDYPVHLSAAKYLINLLDNLYMSNIQTESAVYGIADYGEKAEKALEEYKKTQAMVFQAMAAMKSEQAKSPSFGGRVELAYEKLNEMISYRIKCMELLLKEGMRAQRDELDDESILCNSFYKAALGGIKKEIEEECP